MSSERLIVVLTLLVSLLCGCAADTETDQLRKREKAGEADSGVTEGSSDVERETCRTDVSTERVCDGIDDDCDGRVDEGLARKCALQEGVCKGAVVFCRGGRFPKCSASRYGDEYLKREGPDACDGLDNDCDGEIDEKCRCTPGDQRTCYSGSPQTRGVGQCRAGTQSCESDGTWGPCDGEVLPDEMETCGGGDEDCDGKVDEGCYDSVVPTTSMFGWQSTRPRLELEETGRTCRSRIAIQLTAGAMCYAERGTNQLKCAGEVGDKDFGAQFSDYGRKDVDQVLISRDSTEMCTLADNEVVCFGRNDHGLFGTGGRGSVPVESPVAWGGRTDVAALGTGTWDNLCAVTTSDQIHCAGEQFGVEASRAGKGSTFWLDPSGQLHVDPTDILGVSDNTSRCRMERRGMATVVLKCAWRDKSVSYGEKVVGGGLTKPLPSEEGARTHDVCVLEQSGSVLCTEHGLEQGNDFIELFQGVDVVALVVSESSSSRCVVGEDGSIWCIGDNTNGKLGTGGTEVLTTETQVQPPGSVRFGCY